MKPTIALVAALAATPAAACTDWKAIAAFDAIVWAEFQRDSDYAAECNNSWKAWWSRNIQYSGDVCESTTDITNRLKRLGLIEADREAALADKCQENAR